MHAIVVLPAPDKPVINTNGRGTPDFRFECHENGLISSSTATAWPRRLHYLTSSRPSAFGCRAWRGKDGDSFCKTATSRRENVHCCIDVAMTRMLFLPDTLDLWPQKLIASCAGTAPRRIAKLYGITPVARRGNPQDLADRLDSEGVAMLIDKGLQDFNRRSSSAWATNALASFRISLARRSLPRAPVP